MKLIQTKTTAMETEANFGDSRGGCICNGSVAVANAHNAGPQWCVGYCGSAGTVTKQANADLAQVS